MSCVRMRVAVRRVHQQDLLLVLNPLGKLLGAELLQKLARAGRAFLIGGVELHRCLEARLGVRAIAVETVDRDLADVGE